MSKTIILKIVTAKDHLSWEPVSDNGVQSSEEQCMLVLLILQAHLKSWCYICCLPFVWHKETCYRQYRFCNFVLELPLYPQLKGYNPTCHNLLLLIHCIVIVPFLLMLHLNSDCASLEYAVSQMHPF